MTNSEISTSIEKYLNEIFRFCNLKYSDTTLKKDYEYYFYLILQKLSDNLFTSNLLFKRIEKYPQIYGGLGLILRTCMSDVIIFSYFCTFLNPNADDEQQTDFQEKIKEMWGDHINFIVGFNRKKEEYGYLKGENKAQEITLMNHYFKDYLEQPITNNWECNLKYKNKISIDKILNQWRPKYEHIFKAYELYHLFSKLEHNGELTDKVHNLIFENKEMAFDSILSSFSIVHKTIRIIGRTIFRDIDGAIEKLNQLEVDF